MTAYVVDRIEEGFVVCEALDTGEKTEFPRAEMPGGLREGDVVTLEEGIFRVDAEWAQKRKAELSKRLRGLFSR